MNEKEPNLKNFTEKTSREANVWDWLGRVLPLSAICAISVLHYFQLYEWRDWLLSTSVVVFFTICFIWWYWALRKIVITARYMQRAHEKFLAIAKELKKIRQETKEIDSNR